MPIVGACAGRGGPAAGERPLLLGLPAVVDSVVRTEPLDRTHWGIAAYDPRADRMLLRINYEKHFIPASNTKLVVSAAGLDLLGPDHRYTTPVYATDLEGASASALVVVGSGDPTLSFNFHDEPLSAVRALADSVAQSGVRTVTGPLIVDARRFDDQFVHPAWEVGDLDWRYASPVAAFAIDEATVTAVIQPGAAAGEAARIDLLAPEGTIPLENVLTTDTSYAEYAWGYRRRPVAGFMFEGNVPLHLEPDTVRLPVFRPDLFAGQALAAALRERGITIEGDVVVIRGDATLPVDITAPTTQRVALWRSPPLSEIVAEILKPSNNWVAEQLLKTLGAQFGDEGSWSEGTEVEREWLVGTVGVDSTAFLLRDGSGLSAQNLLSPEAIVDLLRHARDATWGGAFRAALAEPGAEGTLEERLVALSGSLYAKTGTISNVNALSGYVVNAEGNEIVFSILTNGTGMPASDVRPAMDRIVEALARIGAAPPPVPQRQPPPGLRM